MTWSIARSLCESWASCCCCNAAVYETRVCYWFQNRWSFWRTSVILLRRQHYQRLQPTAVNRCSSSASALVEQRIRCRSMDEIRLVYRRDVTTPYRSKWNQRSQTNTRLSLFVAIRLSIIGIHSTWCVLEAHIIRRLGYSTVHRRKLHSWTDPWKVKTIITDWSLGTAVWNPKPVSISVYTITRYSC